ncbi:hypothetical protein KSC_067410 [Ktedonobacter sp. SOSP1-52]|uniref:hypothetical protein n=1 Tax=Ktedonobacter sp. SOSP1-52 TaxID=2778366 RepID=UPI0019153E68|nr:hypothetical protein [Ktedonobacter sp. SOSP1-52]GHO67849.1 hypothetical protein KSC_067410 [Ktedonobacter sp. SOSP1-52]
MRISREGQLVTLINVFETKPEQQQELIDAWVRFVESVMEGGPGKTAVVKWERMPSDIICGAQKKGSCYASTRRESVASKGKYKPGGSRDQR